jgi:hypothetical protein
MRLVKTMPWRQLLSLAGALLAAWSGGPVRAVSLNDNASLKGIKGFRVFVSTNKCAEDNGLTQEKLRNAVELRLRLASVKVANEEEWSKDTGFALINLSIDFYDRYTVAGAYANVTELSVIQTCAVAHNAHRCLVPTWALTTYGFCTAETMQKASEDFVDRLLNAYLEQNPKK